MNSKPFPVETNARPQDGLRDLIEDFLHLRRSSLGATWVTVIFCDDELLLLIRVYYEYTIHSHVLTLKSRIQPKSIAVIAICSSRTPALMAKWAADQMHSMA